MLAKLLLNRFHLLAQQVLALILAHLLLHLLVNFRAKLQHFQFFREFTNERFEPLPHARRFEQLLAH